ncbi:MAG: cyclic nucleotide-binding domain-containing protein [Anaerolineae bacterium]|nr:cyclic nucleotide-binding domain-containing protein [Anaerolineae bacterium]
MSRSQTAPFSLRDQLRPQVLLPAITAGLINGILCVVIEISLGALIFAGDLSQFLPRGIGFMLFGVVIIATFTALTSSFPNIISIPQDSPAAIFATLTALIAASFTGAGVASGDRAFATLTAIIATTTILTGIAAFLLGRFHLGNLVRYIPYPVVGGFLAGTGFFLVQGAFGVMTGDNITLLQPMTLFQADLPMRWVPGVTLGIGLLLILRRYRHFLIIPSVLVAAFALFYAVLTLTNTSLVQALSQKLMLGPFPNNSLWQPPDFSAVAGIDWAFIGGQVGKIAIVVIISMFSLLLNLSGLEVVARRDIDLNRELQVAGVANLLGGLGGSSPGYAALSLSALGTRLGTSSRLVGVITAGVALITLLLGASVISVFPRFLVGGLLFFLGGSFLVEWLIDSWSRFSKQDYGIILVILLVMVAVGILEGVAVGMLFAIVLFVINYSRIDVIKHNFSGNHYRSTVERTPPQEQALVKYGSLIQILELQGFIFFGTANTLLTKVRSLLDSSKYNPTPRYIVLDFHNVTGLDASSAISFDKIQQFAHSRTITLVYTGFAADQRQYFEKEVLADIERSAYQIFPTLDHGVEWCEEQLLTEFQSSIEDSRKIPPRDSTLPHGLGFHFIEKMLQDDFGDVHGSEYVEMLMRITKYFERRIVEKDVTLIQVGVKTGGLYLIESGQATVFGTTPDAEHMRLRLLSSESVAGEVSLYMETGATASVVTTQPTIVYYLSIENLRKIEERDPKVAIVLHRFLGRILSERLVRSTGLLEAISSSA